MSKQPPFLTRFTHGLINGGHLPGLSARQLRALLMFMAHSNGKGHCWPAAATVAAGAGMDQRHAYRAMRALEDKGIVVVVDRGGGRNHSATRRLAIPANSGQNSQCLPSETLALLARNSGQNDTETLAKTARRRSMKKYEEGVAEQQNGKKRPLPKGVTVW